MKKSKEFFVIAHNIRSLLNVGSVFRTADAFRVSKIYLTGYTGTPEHLIHAHKIAKVALGAENFVPWEHSKSASSVIKRLKKAYPSLSVVGLENARTRTISLSKFKPAFPLVLILGEEVKGISQGLINLCDKVVEIPMSGKKESLNVSVAFGVAAYHISNFV